MISSLNFIHKFNSPLLCNVIYSQVAGIRGQASLEVGSHQSAHHTSYTDAAVLGITGESLVE